MSFLEMIENDPNINYILSKIKKIDNLCPSYNDIFNAFKLCPIETTKVVIFGQDPYYTKGVADGLAFSTSSKKTPPSLRNIFLELKNEYPNIEIETNNLTYWAQQGVLLLNTSLTTIENRPNYHCNIGWNYLIDLCIEYINKNLSNVVFVLWGNKAKSLSLKINKNKHFILTSSHPSPMSVKGFWNNNHFIKINEILASKNIKQIDWNLKKG